MTCCHNGQGSNVSHSSQAGKMYKRWKEPVTWTYRHTVLKNYPLDFILGITYTFNYIY